MARVTVEDCIDKVDSPYELVLVAKERATQLNTGIEPTLDRDNDKNTVIALREIAEENIKVDNSSFLKAIWTVLLADFTMSLDNVLGVAGAAKDHYGLLVFGLVLSIILMATAATLISNWIKKYKWIAWLGLFAILIVALDLIYTDIKLLI